MPVAMERLSDMMSAQQSGLRLRRLQKLCSSSGLDALLLVAGMDGKYNAGTQMALSYLFCGHSGRDVVDAGKLPDCLEDVVVVITPDGVSAFCHEQAYAELVKLLVPNFGSANIVCPSQQEAEDPDLYEELKVATFVQFLRNYQRIGVPLSNEMRDGVHISGDPREVDTWPLIQAYGLEGVGNPGFFTQNYIVEGIQKPAQQAYCELDALALEQLLQHNAVNMRKHWQELSVSMTEQSPQTMTELTVAQPLLTYFTHGTIRNAVEVRQVATMPPRVLFGSHSNEEMAKSGSTKLVDMPISDGHPCVHMTVEAADPKSPMRAARTFFLARGDLVKDLFSDAEVEQSSGQVVANGKGGSTQDLVHLARLYAAMASAAQVAMQHFALQVGATVQSAREIAEQQMLQHAANSGAMLKAEDLQQNLQLTLHSADHTNRVSGQARQHTRKVKVLRMALHNIRSQSPDHLGALLGALVYADSFVEVEGGFGEGPQLLVLTAAVPICKFFSCDPSEARAAATAHRNLATWLGHTSHSAPSATTPTSLRPASTTQPQPSASTLPAPLGQLLSTGGGEEVLVLTGAQLMPAVVGYVHFFANGLIFRSRTSNLMPLDVRRDVTSVAIQRLECPELGLPPIGDCLVITGRQSACGLAPASILTNNPCLVIPLASLAPMNRRQLLVKVLPLWQQACREYDVAWQKDLQPGTPLGAQLYPLQWYALAMGGKRWPVPLQDAEVDRALRRLDRLELAAAFPPNPEVEAVLLRHRISQSSSSYESPSSGHSRLAETTATIALSPAPSCTVSVVLVAGLPGAEQQTVAAAIAEVVGGGACVAVQQPVQGAQLDRAALSEALDAAVAQLRNLPGPAATLILTTACYSSMASQLAMLAGTRVFQEGSCQLAAVVASVSTASFYEDDACCCQWLPGALEQMSPGLVDLVVLSGAKHVNRVQALLYLHNPHAPLVRASWQGIVQTAQKLLSSQAERLAKLQEPALAQQRYCSSVSVGASPRGLLCGSLQCVWMQFSGSIDMELLRAALVKLGGTDDNSAAGGSEVEDRKVPLDVCGAEQTPVYAIHFSALIRLEEGGAVQEVIASRGRDVTIRELPAGSQPAASALHLPPGSSPGGEVLVIGAGVTARKISGLLASCQCSPQQDSFQQAGGTAQGVTEEELRMLQERHRFDPLPEGYYFTGSSYVDPFGDTLRHHPSMDQFVAQHLAQVQAQRQHQLSEQVQQAAGLLPFKVAELRETCLGA